jgi:hypothetical protein
VTGELRRPFSYRAFWSLLLAVTGLGLPWSGVELHAAGHHGWTTATHAWMAVHWVSALLFMIAVVGHVVMNGRVLLRYVRGLASRVLPLSREAVAALAITTGLLLLAVGHTRLDRAHDVRGAERGSVDADR